MKSLKVLFLELEQFSSVQLFKKSYPIHLTFLLIFLMQQITLQRDEDDQTILMTESNILILCDQDGLYKVPDDNVKLFLHFKGFRKIQNLENFYNVKTLWLENNDIQKIEGLQNLIHLTHLYLQNNLIDKIEGLTFNSQLHTINLSSNRITRVENIDHLTNLSTLELQQNKLKSTNSIEELKFNKSLCTLNLEDNDLPYDEKNCTYINKNLQDQIVVDRLLQILIDIGPSLRCIYLKGNDYNRNCSNYRKVSNAFVILRNQLHFCQRLPIQIEAPCSQKKKDWPKLGAGEESKKKKKNSNVAGLQFIFVFLEIQQEELLKKEEEHRIIRQSLPKHTLNKLNFFEKQRDSMMKELEELSFEKKRLGETGSNQNRLIIIEQTHETKTSELKEIEEMIAQIKKRAQKQSEDNQLKKQQEEESKVQFDEID